MTTFIPPRGGAFASGFREQVGGQEEIKEGRNKERRKIMKCQEIILSHPDVLVCCGLSLNARSAAPTPDVGCTVDNTAKGRSALFSRIYGLYKSRVHRSKCVAGAPQPCSTITTENSRITV